MTRISLSLLVLVVMTLACALETPSTAVMTVNNARTSRVTAYAAEVMTESFRRHNLDPYRLSPQIDALKQPIEDK